MKKVLITGVSGFIGSHLAQALSEKGYEVYGVLKFSTSRDKKSLDSFLKDTITLTCDIVDYQSVSNTLKTVDPDVVVHLAALSPVRDSFEKPLSYVRNNVEGTLNIAHSMLGLPDFKMRKLIYASTAEVYGIQKASPIKEDAPLNPTSPYSVTKAMTDQYLRMMTNVYGLNTTVMRCTNTYGRKLDSSFYIEYLVTTMLKGEKVYIGAPTSLRDYMYVTDHVNAYISAIEHFDIKGEAFNASLIEEISNKEVAYKIADMIGYDKKKIVLGKYPPNYPLRPLISDQPFILLDNKKIKEKFGWKPTVPLDKGLKMAIDYWKKKYQGG
jgi:nucleoside-diphosphate-sugar epimerase